MLAEVDQTNDSSYIYKVAVSESDTSSIYISLLTR